MELRHLRYFVAVAEEGSFSVAAEKRLHTAQPSLSRQMRDLEYEIGATLLVRGPRGVELTPSGRVFLDYARIALRQVEAGVELARRAAEPPRSRFCVGFLTGYEMEWLPALMGVMRDALPCDELTIVSGATPELVEGLSRGRIDLAFLRGAGEIPGLVFTKLRDEPLIALIAADDPLAGRDALGPEDLRGQMIVGYPTSNAPALQAVIAAYAERIGVDLAPRHLALNPAMAISLVASTKSVALIPLYARNLLPSTVTFRPLRGAAPVVDLSLGYGAANPSRLLKEILLGLDDLKSRVPDAAPSPPEAALRAPGP